MRRCWRYERLLLPSMKQKDRSKFNLTTQSVKVIVTGLDPSD